MQPLQQQGPVLLVVPGVEDPYGAETAPVRQRGELQVGPGVRGRQFQGGRSPVLVGDEDDQTAAAARGLHPLGPYAPPGERGLGELGQLPQPVRSLRRLRHLAERPYKPLRRFESHACVVPFSWWGLALRVP